MSRDKDNLTSINKDHLPTADELQAWHALKDTWSREQVGDRINF